MKLINFSVANFRSITKAHKINIEKMAILIGKNNEGKSNLLKSISVAMRILTAKSRPLPRMNQWPEDKAYTWDTDFPIALKGNKGANKKTIFYLEFSLTGVPPILWSV